MRTVLLTIAVAGLALTASAGAAVPNTWVPEKSLGGVKLDQSRAAVAAHLGEAGRVISRRGDATTVRYPQARIHVLFFRFEGGMCPSGASAPQCSMEIKTASTRYKSAKGIGVGSTVAALRAAYPRVVPYVTPNGSRPRGQFLLPNATTGGLFAPGTIFYSRAGVVTGVKITHSYEA